MAVPYWFLRSGLDADYFAAYAFHATTPGDSDQALHEWFEELQFRNPVMLGTTVSGFVLTNLDEGGEAVDIDLIARDDAKSFTFITVDPTFKTTSLQGDFNGLRTLLLRPRTRTWRTNSLVNIHLDACGS